MSEVVAAVLFGLSIHAIWKCRRARYPLGIVAGALRALLVVVSIVLSFVVLSRQVPPVLAGVFAFVGPALSLGMLLVTWLYKRKLPAADEERLSGAFGAWLAVAAVDAMVVVVLLFVGGITYTTLSR